MAKKTLIMDETAIVRALARITHELIERNKGVSNVVLLGVKTRGVPLAEMLKQNVKKFEGVDLPIGHIDITLHRDDISESDKKVSSSDCYFPCDIRDKTVIIVDDVLFTGRTTRASIDAVFEAGRAKSIRLAVLVDRGHRELPIRADFVGKNVPTSLKEKVVVKIEDVDGESSVAIYENL
jgi:pyrimidine operon attenuation protein/uracil phosphoribosyltransferase